MHRSGTSCLTGSLQEAGLFLGEAHTWNKHNQKGNRENQRIVDFHDRLLADNGGAWDDPPARVEWGEEHVAAARVLLADYAEHAVFGFKDPRALLALDGWKQLVPSIEFVGIFRHPNAVATSLDKRSTKPWHESVELWYQYNAVLYREYEKQRFPILNFDVEEAVLDKHIHGIVGGMGLPGRQGESDKFYSSDLKTNSAKGPFLPWKIRRLYRKLKKASV